MQLQKVAERAGEQHTATTRRTLARRASASVSGGKNVGHHPPHNQQSQLARDAVSCQHEHAARKVMAGKEAGNRRKRERANGAD